MEQPHGRKIPTFIDESEARSGRQIIELMANTCLKLNRSALILPIAYTLTSLKDSQQMTHYQELFERLVLLGLDPNSANYGWLTEPDKESVIDAFYGTCDVIDDAINKQNLYIALKEKQRIKRQESIKALKFYIKIWIIILFIGYCVSLVLNFSQ
jgi:hypothetical protein